MCNVNFPGKLEKFPGILFIQNGSARCAHEWNMTEISIDCHLAFKILLYLIFSPFCVGCIPGKLEKFSGILSIQNGSAVLSVHMSEIGLKFLLIAT